MHQSSIDAMAQALEHFVKPRLQAAQGDQTAAVVDVGSFDVNGTYTPLFDHRGFHYRGVDVQEGPNVDVVMDNPASIPIGSETVDLVISGQLLEHAPRFWEVFAEMSRLLRPGGVLVAIAPSAGPEHRYPVDCYRFLPDSFRSLAESNGLDVIDIRVNNFGPWYDLVGVFEKPSAEDSDRKRYPAHLENIGLSAMFDDWFPGVPRSLPEEQWDADPEDRTVRPGKNYLEVLGEIHREIEPRGYLEIGVASGESLSLATCPAIGIDPDPDMNIDIRPGTNLFRMTSDEYFAHHHSLDFLLDLAFIDGSHLFEVALRDFINIEAASHPDTAVVIDDVVPATPRQASRERQTSYWTGDVWKLGELLARERPDLRIRALDTSPAGMLMVTGLDYENTHLRENYSNLIDRYAALHYPSS
mgnify:CR=1 FL=1